MPATSDTPTFRARVSIAGGRSPAPCHPCVHASSNTYQRPGVRPIFDMGRLQQIPSRKRQFQLPADSPRNPPIARGIGRYQLSRQRAHVPVGEVQLNLLRQVERGLNRHLVLRTGRSNARRRSYIARPGGSCPHSCADRNTNRAAARSRRGATPARFPLLWWCPEVRCGTEPAAAGVWIPNSFPQKPVRSGPR